MISAILIRAASGWFGLSSQLNAAGTMAEGTRRRAVVCPASHPSPIARVAFKSVNQSAGKSSISTPAKRTSSGTSIARS